MKTFLDAIKSMELEHIESKSQIDLLRDGLELFKLCPGFVTAAYFRLDQLEFDFHLNIVAKSGDEEEFNNMFTLLTENQVISKCLASLEIQEYNGIFHNSPSVIIIIPLIGLNCVSGLYVVILSEAPKEGNYFNEICSLFTRNLALTLNILELKEENKHLNEITEQKIAAKIKSVSHNNTDIHVILDSIQTGILLVNKVTDQIEDANIMATNIIGLSKDSLIGTSSQSYFLSIGNNSGSEIRTSSEALIKRSNGKLLPIVKTVSTLLLGGEECLIYTFLDISERKRLVDALQEAHFVLEQRVEERTEELETAKKKVEESNKFKSNLFQNMSHEFRTPLVSIMGFSQIMLEETTDEEFSAMLNIINISGERLLQTLNGVLHLSQIESNDIVLKRTVLDLSEFLQVQLIPFIKIRDDKDISFKTSYIPGILLVSIDCDLFSEVIKNIIDNAFKYTVQGSVDFIVDKTKAEGKDWITINVIDTGIGIPETHQDTIFEAFRQGSEGLTRKYEGCGLGLTLARKLTGLMDGKITLQSEPGKGSTFTIWLPEVGKKNAYII